MQFDQRNFSVVPGGGHCGSILAVGGYPEMGHFDPQG